MRKVGLEALCVLHYLMRSAAESSMKRYWMYSSTVESTRTERKALGGKMGGHE